MNKLSRFEELIAWQKARALTRVVYELTREGPLARDFRLSGQMQHSSVSVMSNVAEGFERGSRAEFHRFLSVAKSSCAELRSQFYVTLDVGYVAQDRFRQLMNQAEELARILGGLRASIGRQRSRG